MKCLKKRFRQLKKKIDLFGKNYRFFHRSFNLGKLEMFKETPKQLKKSVYEAKAIDFFIEFLIYGIFFTTSKFFY